MATPHNQRNSKQYPEKFNTRENRASTHNFSAVEESAAANVTVTSTDGFNFVKLSNAASQDCSLPPAAENKGRCITVFSDAGFSDTISLQESTDTMEGTPGGSITLDAAGEWVDLFCTGSGYIVVRASLASE